MKEKRYEVATWSDDIGTKARMDFSNKREAEKEARKYKNEEEYAAVYDYRTKTAFVVFGNPFQPVFSDFVKVFYTENGNKKRAF